MSQNPINLNKPRLAGPATLLVLLLAAYLVSRAVILLLVTLRPSVEATTGQFVHLRQLDALLGYAGLMAVALVGRMERTRYGQAASRFDLPTTLALTLAVVGAGLSLLWPDTQGRATVDVIVAGAVALAGGLVAMSLFADLAKRRGLTVMGLWQFLLAQWVLAWVGAEVVLRWRLRDEGGVAAHDYARSLVFWLPVFGVLLNAVLMGLTRLTAVATPARMRERGVIVAIIVLNLGAVLSVVGERWLKITGGTLLLVGGLLLWASIGARPWPALLTVAVAAGLLLIERGLLVPAAAYQAAVRHVLSAGVVLAAIVVVTQWADGQLGTALSRARFVRIASMVLLISLLAVVTLHTLTLLGGPWRGLLLVAAMVEAVVFVALGAVGLRAVLVLARR